ncbi:hypothetical protein KIN20_031789 [Parelaphostrongylus tenuis]|uniref:Uncharacterized protein n=1 Tax=Parelaphostrongylus tenuis TaxID=148309 RepID=A0AAD5WH10_PARTN|nr:hypothetical protein KIN20_031789 [Parelaphostrongylus tenuis]
MGKGVNREILCEHHKTSNHFDGFNHMNKINTTLEGSPLQLPSGDDNCVERVCKRQKEVWRN